MTALIVLDPTEPPAGHGTLSPRLDSLDGRNLGILWNGRRPGPGDRVLMEIADVLRRRHNIADVLFRTKPHLGNVAPGELLAEMAARTHAVITGVGD